MIQSTTDGLINIGLKQSNFSIEVNESMFAMLTSKVYTDTKAAIIREWSTNAIDACIAANKYINFDVHIPTTEEPIFSVRDYGTGLSKEDILGLFSTLGASTKRESNAYNGTFGIGRMAGLAYATSFTVESYQNGKYYSYIISMDTGIPVALELADSVTTEPNGLKLSVNIELEDIKHFRDKAEHIYRYFDTKPNLNIELNIDVELDNFATDAWFIDKYLSQNYILMSNVLYTIPQDSQIRTHGFTSLVMRADTGSVSINPGRESLSIDKETIKFINDSFDKVKQDFMDIMQETLDECNTPIDKINTFLNAYKSAPYKVQESLNNNYHRLIGNNPLTNCIKERWGTLMITSAPRSIEFKLKMNYYKTLRNIDNSDLTLKDFNTKYKICLVDLATGFRQDVMKYHEPTMLLIQKESGVKLEEFLPIAEKFLEDLGITDYIKASDFCTPVEKNAKSTSTRSAGIYAYHVSSAGLSSQYKLNPDKNYWYITSNKSTPDDVDWDKLEHMYRYIPNPKPSLVAIPKKYQKDLDQMKNLIPAKDAIIERVEDINFTIIHSDLLNYYARNRPSTGTIMPQDIKEFFEELDNATKIYNDSSVPKINCETTFSTLSDYFPVKATRITPKITRHSLFQKYKLLKNLIEDYGVKTSEVDHYLMLEKIYHDSLCKNTR